MGDQCSENVNKLLGKSASQIKTSLEHLTKSIKMLEKAMKEQECLNNMDIYLAKRELISQECTISELEEIMKRKQKSFSVLQYVK